MVKHDTLLICSNLRETRQDLRRVFSGAFNLLEAGDVTQLMLLLRQNIQCIAAVLLDISSLEESEKDWIDQEENRAFLSKIPVIILSEKETPAILNQAFDMGASDVIALGYDPDAMLHRVDNIVDLHLHKQNLEIMVEEQKQLLRHSSDTLVGALSSIIEYRSVESSQHILRIRHFTKVLLEEVARCCPEYGLTEESISIICSASALHDIGKIAIPDDILMKTGPLTAAEREIMKTHCLTGCRILETLEGTTDKEYLRYAHNICHYHHERWDGGGYPEGLQGEAIPICAQVVALADVYDALSSKRVYKQAYSFSKATNMILQGECGVFSPKLLDCFKTVAPQFQLLAGEYADGKQPEKEVFSAESLLSEMRHEDAMEGIRGKYFALIHYVNGLLMELDMDRGLFHLVYNPYPELASIREMNTLDEIVALLLGRFVHPEDREKMEWFLLEEIFRFLDEGLRRGSYYIRGKSTNPEGELFELTLLRVNPTDDSRRSLALLARKVEPDKLTRKEASRSYVPMEGTFACKNDAHFTLLNLGRADSLLAGYTDYEIRDLFGNRLMELVYPDDREMIRREFTQQLRTGTEARAEFRVCYKDGTIHWVYNHSRLVTDPEGQEVICSYLVDIENLRREDNLLMDKLQRYEMILAQTENVLFEWDLERDIISFSDTWEKIFGYPLPGSSQRWSQQWISCLHPDDMPLLSDCIGDLKNGAPYAMTEVRMATAQGRYLWCRFRATALRDSWGNLEKIIGVIINIDSEKREEQALQSRAEQDPLTKLLNRDAARKQAEAYFAQYSGEAGGALLLIDLDNFKQINDRKGHLFGDAVLVEVAQKIRKLFRGQDIVARIGGDEFMVVMRGITDRKLLEHRCQQLLQLLGNAFRSYQLALSCSIGIALAKEHGQSYFELFQSADKALYRAKAKGKNGYAIYNAQDSAYLNQPGRTSLVNNPIDSDTEPGMANDNIVRYAFRKLYSSQDMAKSINELLAFIGEKTNASRVYVFENSEDNRFCSNTFEWCNQGVSPQIGNLQNICYETEIPDYADNFDEQGIFYCPDVEMLPKKVYDIVAPQGIKAMLHCAIRENGVFRGYIGFDDCTEARMWTREQIELLTFFSESLSLFLLRQRRQEKTQRQAEEMQLILDSQNAWVYVVDPDTHQLLYVNSQLREKFPGMMLNTVCYQLLEDREAVCTNCPMARLKERQNFSCLHRREGEDSDILLEATKIRWNDTQAVLISGRRLPGA